jgi:hypothetical protein
MAADYDRPILLSSESLGGSEIPVDNATFRHASLGWHPFKNGAEHKGSNGPQRWGDGQD